MADTQHLGCCAQQRVGSSPTRAIHNSVEERCIKLKLEVVVTDVSQVRKDLEVEVPAEEVKAEYEKAYDAYARYAKVPGFRPGRVPRGVVKQRFSKEVKDEVIGQLLPHALQHAIVDNKLRFIGEPHITELSVSEGEPLKFKAGIEVMPEVELKEYKGLKVTKRVARVTDEDVERVIENWRENAPEFVPIEDRPSQDGDFVQANLIGKYLDPQAAHEHEDLKAEGADIELGGQHTPPEFTENLRGVKADDVREFRVAYPEDFESKGLAGKTLDFTATILAVRRKELPELNDDFAKDFGDYETMQEMRDKVREALVKNAEGHADAALRDQLVQQIVDEYDFEVPPSLVNQQMMERLNEMASYLLRSGVPEQVVKKMNWESQLDSVRAQALREARTAMVISRIGETEGIEVGKDEIDAEMERAAAAEGETLERLKARLTSEEAISSIESSIENRLRFRKTLDAIVGKAEITVEEFDPNEAPAAVDEPQPEVAQAQAAAE